MITLHTWHVEACSGTRCPPIPGFGSRVSGFGGRVSGIRCRVSGVESRVSDVECRISSVEGRVSSLGSGVSSLGFRGSGSGLGFRASGFGYRVSGVRCQVSGIDLPPHISRRRRGCAQRVCLDQPGPEARSYVRRVALNSLFFFITLGLELSDTKVYEP